MIKGMISGKRFLTQKKERIVIGILYSATLKEQNYSLWKC